jgi:hypothetical protein
MTSANIHELMARVAVLERKMSHIPNPDVQLPGDLDGLGSVLFCVVCGFASFVAISIVMDYFSKRRK